MSSPMSSDGALASSHSPRAASAAHLDNLHAAEHAISTFDICFQVRPQGEAGFLAVKQCLFKGQERSLVFLTFLGICFQR